MTNRHAPETSPGIQEWIHSAAGEPFGSKFAHYAYSGSENHKTTIIVRLPDGRIVTITGNLPKLPLGL